ncbi:MAG: hypothetical protein JXB49_06150 [Bacteroidales bacterium]|nr:hypothetical protein [Bacteroidales bacterium]
MLEELKQNILLNLKNIPGWRTDRKIVVIECDDWGGIRMPSKEVYDLLVRKGLKINQNRFNLYDTLESVEDLEQLFECLNSVRDINNQPAVITAITNVANPDFERIKLSGFSEYYYESFPDTIKRYYPNKEVFKLWREGTDAGIFIPELHGREHISVQLWLQKLREGDKNLLMAFENGFTAVDLPGLKEPESGFRAEFYFNSDLQKPFLIRSIKEGVSLFGNIFGIHPRIFVPGNGIFHPDFDKVVASAGIRFLYVNHKMAYPVKGGNLKYRRFITGKKGPGGLTYYTRNCAFEPTEPRYLGADFTLKQVEAAFRWGKLANISTHRVNFVGGMDISNRIKGLTELKLLLKKMIRIWPDIEFMSSGDALDYMKNKN